jgi:SAM-dependent methyltransferase
MGKTDQDGYRADHRGGRTANDVLRVPRRLRRSRRCRTDDVWAFYGEHDPYFGVLTDDAFLSGSLTEESRQEFFSTGQSYVESLRETIGKQLCSSFAPTRALDFGCGVGRITLPLARFCSTVVGVDISEAMLAEARHNSEREGLTNIEFMRSDDDLSSLTGTFDFIHSFIVFQHITPERGLAMMKRILHVLTEGGIGALHFTYFDDLTPLERARYILYMRVPALWALKNKMLLRPSHPMLQMHNYSLSKLFRLLQTENCHKLSVQFSYHGKFGGVILLFEKTTLPFL